MIRITNASDRTAKCFINDKLYILHAEETVFAEEVNTLRICHDKGSYYCPIAESSKTLKFLGFIGDPFKLLRDYHIAVDSFYELDEYHASKQLVITHVIRYVDAEINTYYDYFVLHCDDRKLIPKSSQTIDADLFLQEFNRNNRKLAKWNTVWNFLIEPIVFKIIGYFLIYCLFSIWLGTKALYVVLTFLAFSLLLEMIFVLLSKKKRYVERFHDYLINENIHRYLYIDNE